MSGTYAVSMGDRGRVVIPAELRERMDLRPGSPLVLVETPDGVILASRSQVRELVQRRLKGPSLVEELLAERRAQALIEDEE